MANNDKVYKSIGEVAKILNLIDKKTGKLSTHTIRFWEKEFRQIKPYKFSGNRRYYDDKAIIILKKIQNLLKNKGMTIKGVKMILQNEHYELEDNTESNLRINNRTLLKILNERIQKKHKVKK